MLPEELLLELLVLPELPPLSSSPQKALRERAHATSEPPQIPSTHAAARYDPPLEQLQQLGLQSAYVVQLAPALPVPRSFSGFVEQPPFTCSALDEMFWLEPLELLAVPGSFGSDPLAGDDVPPLHAKRSKPANEETREAMQRFVISRRYGKARTARDVTSSRGVGVDRDGARRVLRHDGARSGASVAPSFLKRLQILRRSAP
ncbi:MAG: hypothetical protein K0S65_328 [Labilithrix sp.]|nr:hypothetical protein [Labilithrix sp.]